MLKITTVLVDFCSWSTVACVRNVAFSKSKWLRFIWFLVFLAMVAAFIAQFVMIIQKYLSYPADTSTTIVFSSQPFPDVTICSFNPFKLSEVSKNADFAEIKKMLDEYTAAEQGTTGGNVYGFQGLDRFARLDKANDLLVFFAAKLTEAQKAPALYKVEELVTECLFAGNTCDPDIFEAVPDPVYGRCFVYRGSTQTITRPGLAHGLRLIVTANLADSLTFVSDYLPTTSRVGVRMTINENNSIVELDNRGFNVGVGYQTSIALSKSRTERIQAPYGDCVKSVDPSMNHYSELPYTIDSCFTTCMQKRFVERCGCAHPTYRKADNETWCSTAEHATCIATHRGDQLNSTDINLDMMRDCGCKNPCTESYFSSTLSVLTYPAFGYTVGVGTTQQNQNQQQEQKKTTTTTTTTVSTTTNTESTTTGSTSSTSTSTTTKPSTSTTTKPSTTTTTRPSTTTSTTSTTTTTTGAPTTTTTNCGSKDYRNNPAYLAAYTEIVASGMFKLNPEEDPCTPRFECDPAYSKQWWKCWPCYYECNDGARLPPSPWTTPNVKCSVFFKFAQIEMGWATQNDNPTTRPGWNNWFDANQSPSNGNCNSERNTINNPVWIQDCSTIRNYASTSSVFDWNSGSTTVTKKTPTANWYDGWPCSYPCTDGTRFPTKPVFSNVRCYDFFRCASVDLSPYVVVPTFNGWPDGNSNGYNCAAMKVPGSSGGSGPISGRKKRAAVVVNPTALPSSSSTTSAPTVKSMGMPGKGSCESWNTNFKSVDDCKSWYKKNGMIVNVYYESLEYQVLTEEAAYSVSQAVNDLGGQAGLWLGLSVISIVECIGLLCLILLFCVTGKSVSMRMEKEARYDDDDIMPPRKATSGVRMLKVTTILVDFACWSTVACVRNVALSGTKLLRLFWFLVFVAMVVAFVAQLVMIILKYISFPADVSTTIVFSSQPFPDVTFCNYNPYKWSVVSTNPDFNDIKRMLIEYRDADDDVTSGSNEFGFEGLSRFERQDRANDLLVFLAAQLTDDQKEPALYHLEELVTECLFAGNTCDPDLIEEVSDPVYGRCFVYRGANQTITRSGLAHGLRLILTANLADSFTFVSDYLPTTLRVGVRMTVNEEDALVSLDNHGFNVGVGFQTSIAISKSRTERIQEPYGHCLFELAPEMNYYSDLPYTIDSCFISCLQKRIVERCGCAHPQYRQAGNDTWCSTPTDASCVARLRGDQLNSTDPNLSPIGDCGCQPPCRESYFSSTLSVLRYPAFGYTVGVGTTTQLKDLKKDQETKTTQYWTPKSTTTGSTTTRVTTTKASTTVAPSTTKITTPVSIPVTTGCDYTTSPFYQQIVLFNLTSTKKFKVYPASSNPCIPVFECDPKYADDWWTCWPCFYECSNYRLPTSQYSTPNVNCRDYFAFAKVATGWGDSSSSPTARPDWNNWNVAGNPPQPGCNAERDKMNAATTGPSSPPITSPAGTSPMVKTTTPVTTSTTSTTTTKASTTTTGGWISDCDDMKTLMSGWGASWFAIPTGGGKPTAFTTVTTENWFNYWPCSYKCADSTRFPTNATLGNVRCVDFFNCFKINTDKFTNKPTFNDWDQGGSGNDDCAAMKNVGSSGGLNDNGGGGGPVGGGGGGGMGGGSMGPGGRRKRSTSTNSNATTPQQLGMPGKGSCESWNSNFKTVDDCQEWYKKNGMIVNVYYETLEYQVLTESAAYSLSAAVNDLGGQAGLWLGLSVVSVVECIGLFFMILLFCITGKRMTVTPNRDKPMPDLGHI